METHKDSVRIRDYSVSQTSLEEVFLDFAKLQEVREVRSAWQKCCSCCYSSPPQTTTVVMANSSARV